jgi:hypothetical protein
MLRQPSHWLTPAKLLFIRGRRAGFLISPYRILKDASLSSNKEISITATILPQERSVPAPGLSKRPAHLRFARVCPAFALRLTQFEIIENIGALHREF